MTGRAVAMPCVDGRQHKWRCVRDGGHEVFRPSGVAWHPKGWDRCATCEAERDGVRWECNYLCDHRDASHERWETDYPTYYEMRRNTDWDLRPKLVNDKGNCGDCQEVRRRQQLVRERRWHADLYQLRCDEAQVRRMKDREEARRLKEEAWRHERAQRMEVARQRALLSEGHQTLTAIRRFLRDPVSSRPPESRPAKTSPTS